MNPIEMMYAAHTSAIEDFIVALARSSDPYDGHTRLLCARTANLNLDMLSCADWDYIEDKLERML